MIDDQMTTKGRMTDYTPELRIKDAQGSYAPQLLELIATKKRSWVLDVPYDYLLIQLGEGPKTVFIKSKQASSVFQIEFVDKDGKAIPGPEALRGSYTGRATLNGAVREYASLNRIPMKFEIITADGQTVLPINPKAL